MGDAEIKEITKKLTINTKSVQRIMKDIKYYKKEADQEDARAEKMKQDGKDEHDVQKQIEVATESRNMISDSKGRLHGYLQTLKGSMEKASEAGLAQSKEYSEAQTVYDEANSFTTQAAGV